MLESVSKSAWMPAPPVGSVAAKLRTIGGREVGMVGAMLELDTATG
jgi:hypothetical protein